MTINFIDSRNNLEQVSRGKKRKTGEECYKISVCCVGKRSSSRWVSLVMDASCKRGKKKGAMVGWEAAVSQAGDSNDSLQLRGAKRIFAEDALPAECYAIWWGLCKAVISFRNVIIKSDCKNAVDALINLARSNYIIAPVVKQNRSLAISLDYVVCINVGRDIVAKAHILANQAQKGPQVLCVCVFVVFAVKKKISRGKQEKNEGAKEKHNYEHYPGFWLLSRSMQVIGNSSTCTTHMDISCQWLEKGRGE